MNFTSINCIMQQKHLEVDTTFSLAKFNIILCLLAWKITLLKKINSVSQMFKRLICL